MAQDHTFQIALWGPPASGKSCYLAALSQKIRGLTVKDTHPFSYQLTNTLTMRSINLDFSAEYIPTLAPKEESWRFRCTSKTHSLNNQAHSLRLIDDSGTATISSLTLNRVRLTSKHLRASNGIIALLDYAAIRGTLRGELGETLGSHAEQLGRLVRLLSIDREPHDICYLALCLPKTDMLTKEERKLPVRTLFENCFGYPLDEFHIRMRPFAGLRIQIFQFSAVGFQDIAEINPNYHDGALVDTRDWNPWQVEQPLFWMLEMEERRRWQNAGNWIAKTLFGQKRPDRYQSKLPLHIRGKQL